MNTNRYRTFFLSILAPLAISVIFGQDLPDNIDISTNAEGIVAMPASAPSAYSNFPLYTKVITPNGGAIHIVAQNQISTGQIVRAREVLRMFLTDIPGSEYGVSKGDVANQMAANDAILILVNGTHSEGNEPNLPAQPLYQNEMQVEGHSWYMNQNYDHRDATYEEILHLVHDTGIGVDGANTYPGVRSAYQSEIRTATNNAIADNFQIWPLGARSDRGWYNNLSAENSLTQEYLASLIDSYYGLWGAWTRSTTNGMWGEYISKTRSEITTEDPMGWALLPKFFPDHLTYEARIDSSHTGTFTMAFDAAKPYTNHSQYLLKARLVGTNNSHLTGNSQANTLTGNQGNNILDGAAGDDTAIFKGARANYTATDAGGGNISIVDGTAGRDGSDTLVGIEFVMFSDGTVSVADLLGGTTSQLDTWRAQHFASEFGDPALEVTVWGNHADPDGDGRSNLAEFAFGTDPRQGSGSQPLSNVRMDGTTIRLTINALVEDTETVVTAQISTDLKTWTDITTSTVHDDTTRLDGRHTLDIAYPIPENAPAGYVRYIVSRN